MSTSQDSNTDTSREMAKADLEKEIQKLRLTIEDKNYHIGNLQNKLLEAQLELEHELDKHEDEIESLRAQLGGNEMNFEKMVEDRLFEVRSQYEKELEVLRARIENNEDSTSGALSNIESCNDRTDKEKFEPNADGVLGNDVEQLLEKERTKYRVEIMAVKDGLNHQHRVELDELITKLEQSNAEVEELRDRKSVV